MKRFAGGAKMRH